jgi:tetratricopeptide (TPR) repeat protein
VPYVALGRVSFTGATAWAADRGVQLRAGARGADAVIRVERRKCPDVGPGARTVSGVAVRVEDAADRPRLRLRWFGEEVAALTNRMLLLLVLQAALLFMAAAFLTGVSRLQPATGLALPRMLEYLGLGLAVIHAWPIVLLALLRVLRWPGLLQVAGLAVLAVTAGRGLAVLLAHLLAVRTTGTAPANGMLWVCLDPFSWACIIAGVVLFVRSRRLARDAAYILPPEVQEASPARKGWGRGLLLVTGCYALALLGLAGYARYQASARVLRPGVEPPPEQQAGLALDEGSALANEGELGPAEQSLRRSLRLWEELTTSPAAPPLYRDNLVITLYDLGLVCERQGRGEEAEKHYARAVALAEARAGEPHPADNFVRTEAKARAALARLRGEKVAKVLDDKERTACRKYEEAQVRVEKAPAEADRLYAEAIALWEEILLQATADDYRKAAVARLATAHLLLGELRQRLGERAPAEEALKKGIEYGEKAVAQDPDRPLPRHNLETARRLLEELREQAQEEEVTRLCAARRFADAADLYRRGVTEQEEQVRSGKDHDAAVQRLASRLERSAWFLAHCPDEDVRDTKAAVKHATRAAQLQPDVGDYWFTLAVVQYRNRDWRDSLASLERVRTRDGGFSASAWLVAAMDRYQLGQKEEARAALRSAREWMRERERKAEDDAVLRFQYELMRPGIESLRREAENLIEGGDAARSGTG